MLIKLLLISSIALNTLGFHETAQRFDNAATHEQVDPSRVAVASRADLDLPQIVARPKIKSFAPKPNIFAHQYILVDQESDKILAKQGPHESVPIASTTKIMTAVVALENYDLDEVVTISSNAANMIGATANFRTGEKLTVESLLKALLIKSANGAAYALAEHMNDSGEKIKSSASSNSQNGLDTLDVASAASQTEDESSAAQDTINPSERAQVSKFVAAMNAKAKSLGMENTDYHDPAGLDTTGYSSAFDLYLVTKYALKKQVFADIVQINHASIKNIDGSIWHELKNSNRLIGEYQYPGAIGVKTGYMPEAGHVLVSAAKRDGHTLIGVVINTYADTAPASADESRKLLNWGFENVEWR